MDGLEKNDQESLINSDGRLSALGGVS
jgi:hypothetical protein